MELERPSESPRNAPTRKHAFLIFAHNNFYVLEKLLQILDDERNDIYLHLDKKAGRIDTARLESHCARSRLIIVPRVKVYWGDYSQVRAVVQTMGHAIKGEYSYFHVLSGTDLPLQSNDHLHAFFTDHAGKEFVAFNDFPPYTQDWLAYYYPFNTLLRARSKFVRRIYSRFRKTSIRAQRLLRVDRTRSFGLEVKYGSDWFSITQELAQYLVGQQKAIKRILGHAFNPVEYYVQTMVWNSPFRDRVFDFDDPYRSNMRLIDFRRGTGSSPHVWTMDDIQELTTTDRLFARKFDPDVDAEVIDVITRRLLHGR